MQRLKSENTKLNGSTYKTKLLSYLNVQEENHQYRQFLVRLVFATGF
jgi:hypothetical protein